MKENNKIHQESLFTEEECPTIESQEQPTDPRIMLRIKTVELNNLLNKIVKKRAKNR